MHMPIYEYRCPTCGETFEKLVRFGSTESIVCPRCSSDKPERLISLFAQTSGGATSVGSSQSSCTTST